MHARESQLKGRLRLRHLAEVAEARAEEMAEQRDRFSRLADPGTAPRVVFAFNLFQTPEPLAARVAELVSEGRDIGRTLEPSAGLGRLYRAIRFVSATNPVVLVEIAPECSGELYRATEGDAAATLIQADFLACDSSRLGDFDTVVMNPPFCRGLDIKHIQHALAFLRPGGRLVAICAAGSRRREAFADVTRWIDLPAGTFKGEGTNVGAAIVVFDR